MSDADLNNFKEMAESLYIENFDHIYKVVFVLVNDKVMVEDIVHEAFFKAFKNIDKLRDNSKFKSWLTSIAINLSKDYMAKTSREFPVEHFDYEHIVRHSLKKHFRQTEISNDIEEVLGELGYEEKALILLKYYSGLTSREIAYIYKITVENVNIKIFRAKHKLKRKLQQQPGKEA